MRLLSPPQREQLSVSSGWSDKTPPGHLTLLVPDGGAASAAAAVAFLRYEGINVSSDRCGSDFCPRSWLSETLSRSACYRFSPIFSLFSSHRN
ncbi:hypothetical protein AGIG_G11266 [Arapaima gigas]